MILSEVWWLWQSFSGTTSWPIDLGYWTRSAHSCIHLCLLLLKEGVNSLLIAWNWSFVTMRQTTWANRLMNRHLVSKKFLLLFLPFVKDLLVSQSLPFLRVLNEVWYFTVISCNLWWNQWYPWGCLHLSKTCLLLLKLNRFTLTLFWYLPLQTRIIKAIMDSLPYPVCRKDAVFNWWRDLHLRVPVGRKCYMLLDCWKTTWILCSSLDDLWVKLFLDFESRLPDSSPEDVWWSSH